MPGAQLVFDPVYCRMKVLTFTSLYPNNMWPNHGVFIKERMATKEDVRDIAREVIRAEVPPMIEAVIQKTVPPMIEEALRPIYRELRAIRDDLENLRDRVKDMAGYRKEIDYAFERIAAIEKHLGIDRKQVA